MDPWLLFDAFLAGFILKMFQGLWWVWYSERKGWMRHRSEMAYPDQPWNFTGYPDPHESWGPAQRALLRKDNQGYWGRPRDEAPAPANVIHREKASEKLLQLAAEYGVIAVTQEELEYYRSLERYVALVEPEKEGEWPNTATAT